MRYAEGQFKCMICPAPAGGRDTLCHRHRGDVELARARRRHAYEMQGPGALSYYHSGLLDYAEFRAHRSALGLCVQCERTKLPRSTKCVFHTVYARLYGATCRDPNRVPRTPIDADVVEALITKLAAQGNRCHYSGVPIELGVNADLEHDVPLTRGGKTELSNLVWACRSANRKKHTRTGAEFMEAAVRALLGVKGG